MRIDSKEVIEKNTGAVWNKKGMSIDIIIDPIIAFLVCEIAHRFFQLRRINHVPYNIFDLGYKIVT